MGGGARSNQGWSCKSASLTRHFSFAENTLKNLAKMAGGRWDPEKRLWIVPFGKVKGTALEKHIVLDAAG
jgi:hypothetical protein